MPSGRSARRLGLFFATLGGVIADHVDKRRLLMATQAGLGLLALLLAMLTITGLVRVWQVIVIAFCSGLVTSLDMPARQAFVVEMVGPADLMNASALNSTVFNTARVVGPTVAGLLVATVGEAGAFFINSASFLAVIGALAGMRLVPRISARPVGGVRQALGQGIRYVLGHDRLLSVFALVASVTLFASSYAVLLPLFARNVLGVGAVGFGYLVTAAGAGALMAALGMATGRRARYGLQLVGGMVGMCLSLAVLSFSRLFALSLLALVGVGFSFVTFSATANTTIQTIVSDEFRGRVMGVYTQVFAGFGPLASLLGGTFAHALGAPGAVLIAALLTLATGSLVIARNLGLLRLGPAE